MREKDEHLDPHDVTRRLRELLAGKFTEDALPGEFDSTLRQAGLLERKAAEADTAAAEVKGSCPGEEVWAGFAAGRREAEIDSLLGHAARCNLCSAKLRNAMNMFVQPDEAADDETVMLPDLASSTPAWQSAMARQLGQLAPARPKPRRLFLFPGRMVFALAAGLLVAVAGASYLLWQSTHNSDAVLLARAYDQQRRTELRIPGGHDVPLAFFTRGEKVAHEPAELSELYAQVERRLKADPKDAGALRMRGRIDLLRAQPLSALDDFEQAQQNATQVHLTLAGIEGDLAAAWFEIAEQSGDPKDFTQAATRFSIEANRHPANASVVLYNRALSLERAHMDGDTVRRAFEEALAAETSQEWRKAIQEHLDRLKPHAEMNAAPDFEAALGAALAGLPGWDFSATSR